MPRKKLSIILSDFRISLKSISKYNNGINIFILKSNKKIEICINNRYVKDYHKEVTDKIPILNR